MKDKVNKINILDGVRKNWWGEDKRIPNLAELLVLNKAVSVNGKVIEDPSSEVPLNAFLRKVPKNAELSTTVFNRYLSREKPRRFKRAKLSVLKSGSKVENRILEIEKRTTSQLLFKNKQNFKSFYKVKMKDLKKVNLELYSGSIFQYLESRLDMVVFRLGFAGSLDESRKLIKGGHIFVNNVKVKHPSAVMKAGWTIKTKWGGASFNFLKCQQLNNTIRKDYPSQKFYLRVKYPMTKNQRNVRFINWNEAIFLRPLKLSEITLPKNIKPSLVNLYLPC